MQEIQVIFPKPSGSKPVVNHPIERGFSNEKVVWNIVNCDPTIKYVEIEFEQPKAKFFREPDGPGTPDATRLVRRLGSGGHVQIYGHAPDYKNTNPVQDKYTIRGWRKNPLSTAKKTKAKAGEKDPLVTELDPLFVTDKP